jgi:hypothetical protein
VNDAIEPEPWNAGQVFFIALTVVGIIGFVATGAWMMFFN